MPGNSMLSSSLENQFQWLTWGLTGSVIPRNRVTWLPAHTTLGRAPGVSSTVPHSFVLNQQEMCSGPLLQKGDAGQDTVSSSHRSYTRAGRTSAGNWQNQPVEPGFGWPQVDLGTWRARAAAQSVRAKMQGLDLHGCLWQRTDCKEAEGGAIPGRGSGTWEVVALFCILLAVFTHTNIFAHIKTHWVHFLICMLNFNKVDFKRLKTTLQWSLIAKEETHNKWASLMPWGLQIFPLVPLGKARVQ